MVDIVPTTETADATATTTVAPEPSAELLAAREALAKRYDERNMTEAAACVRNGAWDSEPMVTAIVDVLTPPA